jgi:cellulose biosynthesis protein BcsQ
MLTPATRKKLRRVIAVMNSKGGVGKTSVTTNLGGVLAEAGYHTLLIDLDPQGNTNRDLGYRDTDFNDQGEGLYDAVVKGIAIQPVKGVRNNLDVVPAGRFTSMISTHLATQMMQGTDVNSTLAQKLAEIAEQYDIVLIDCPPGEPGLQTQALVAARWILIPTEPDDASLDGLSGLADRVVGVHHLNPEVAPLGVVLFGIPTSGTRIQADAREKLASIMGGICPVFKSMIRHAKAAAVDARNRGQLTIELANDAEGQDRFAWKRALKNRYDSDSKGEETDEPTRLVAASAGSLAGDYLQLTAEVLETLSANEKKAAETVGAQQ